MDSELDIEEINEDNTMDEKTPEVKTKKKTKKTREQIEECNKQMEDLENAKAEYEKTLVDLEKESDQMGERSAIDMKVKHNKYGVGTIVKQNGKYVDVEFETVTKKFVLPGAIADKYLKTDDNDVLDYYIRNNDIHNKILKVQLQIRSTDFAMERLSNNIYKLNQKA